MTKPITDRMTYICFVLDRNGVPYIAERATCDLDKATTIKDIASGEITDLVQVIECNPVEGICSDVTDSIAREVMNRWANNGEPLTHSQYEFVELFVGTRAARSFICEVA